MFKIKNKFALAAGLASALIFSSAPTAVYAAGQVEEIPMQMSKSFVKEMHTDVKSVSVANKEVADVQVIDSRTLNIIAINTGSTAINVWTVDGMLQTFIVIVNQSDEYSARVISDEIKAAGIHGVIVMKSGDTVFLRGTVENQYEKDVAGEIAALCILRDEKLESETRSGSSADAILSKVAVSQKIDVTDNVVNLLELRNPDQINISAMIIEIDSNDAKELGIKYGADVSNPGVYYLGESYGDSNRPNSGWFGRNWLYAHFSQINAQIGLALKNGKARVISEPNVTTMSGQDARIHVGGKITVPLTNSNGSMTTEDKEYGVELSLAKPVLDRQGNITTTLTTAVSKLDWGNAVNGIPGMRERSASTVVNIPSGMTMVIGGLMDSSDEETINKVPLLGNIPILGELFKYHDTTHNDSEILILITPRAVNEHSPVDMSKKMRDMYDTRRRNIEKGEHVDVNDPPGPSEEEKKAAAKAAKEAKDNEGKMLKLNKEAKGEAAEGDAAKAAVRENNAPPVESANSTAPVAADKKDSDKVAGATTVADETAGNAKVTETPSVMGKFLNRRVLK